MAEANSLPMADWLSDQFISGVAKTNKTTSRGGKKSQLL